MVCSPEQLASNRRNALKSKGPTTAGGKERSRRNGLKHGLTGAGVVVPDEDSAAIEGRFEAFRADLKPKDAVAEFLVRRVAFLSVRLERSARHEAAEITRGMVGAVDLEAEAIAQEVDSLVGSIADDPAASVRQLRRTPEGLDRLAREWDALKAKLARAAWNLWRGEQGDRAERLLGQKPEPIGTSRVWALTQAIQGNFKPLDPGDWPDLDPDARRQAARAEMGAIIDAEIARIDAEKAALDREAIDLVRASAPARALFDTSKQSILARKYEAAAEREFHRSLERIEQLNAREEAEAPDAAEDANPNPEAECDELGSSFPGATPATGGGPRRELESPSGPACLPEEARASDLPRVEVQGRRSKNIPEASHRTR